MAGLILPQQVSAASSWSLEDFRTLQAQSDPAGPDGTATIELEQLDNDEMWLVDHAVVTSNSALDSSVRLYAGGVADLNLLSGSDAGNFDEADWPNGLQLQPGQSLTVRWDGVSEFTVGTIALQVRVMRRA